MLIYIFASVTYPTLSALTSDQTGNNLLPAYAPWRPVNDGQAQSTGHPSKSVIAAVQRDGFFLLTRSSRTRHK